MRPCILLPVLKAVHHGQDRDGLLEATDFNFGGRSNSETDGSTGNDPKNVFTNRDLEKRHTVGIFFVKKFFPGYEVIH